MVREGLGLLGIPQTVVLKHSCPRIVYGVELAKNTKEYLRGEASEPQYTFPPQAFRKGTESIIDFWMTRWLAPRSNRPETLQKVQAFSTDELLLSRELNETRMATALL
jgi:hypothetical protein